MTNNNNPSIPQGEGPGVREVIARIVDPTPWGIREYIVNSPHRETLNAARRQADLPDEDDLVRSSLFKADAILEALSTLGERNQGDTASRNQPSDRRPDGLSVGLDAQPSAAGEP